MNTASHLAINHTATTVQRPHPLLSVIAWEMRRLFASRATWFFMVIALGVFLLVMWLQKETGTVAIPLTSRVAYGGKIAYASVWDLLDKLGSGAVALSTIVLFFICTDGIARDLKQRTHELVMATSMPTWAYVWGRYLSILIISLGLAVELLIAIIVIALVMHLTVGGNVYPAPHVDLILGVWASHVLPIIFCFSSLSFAAGTLWPRRTNLIKTALFITWFIVSFLLLAALGNQLTAWFANWDPTGSNILEGSPDRYRSAYLHQLQSANLAHVPQTAATNSWALQVLHTLQYQFVDFWSWFGPHLTWDGLAFAAVVLAAFTFRRFRGA